MGRWNSDRCGEAGERIKLAMKNTKKHKENLAKGYCQRDSCMSTFEMIKEER